MTRVLYWNINNFSKNKILNDVGPDPAFQMSQDRLAHIVKQVVQPNPPDIFIVEECYARVREVGYPGGIINTDGSICFAVLLLLDELRKLDPAWCLVPPLKVGNLGFCEGVAVYYKAQNLQFTGPAVYSLQGGLFMARRPGEIPEAAVAEYPEGLNEALPGATNPDPLLNGIQRTWPTPFAGGVGNVQLPERVWAAQFEQRRPDKKVIQFPGPNNRTPYLTRFRDLANKRTLKIFSIHTSPATATDGTNRIPFIDEVITVRDDEVCLIVGDFNVDSFDMSANGAYDDIIKCGYTWLFDARDGDYVWTERKPYLMTHMLPATVTDKLTNVVTQTAFPYNTAGWPKPDVHHNVYPRYGYMGSWVANNYSDWGAIDNAFVRYGSDAVLRPPSHSQTIVNTVAGKPYTAPPALPHVTAELTGGLTYTQTLATPIPPGGLPAAGGDVINFSHWNNFGRIRSTSDHLALIMDI